MIVSNISYVYAVWQKANGANWTLCMITARTEGPRGLRRQPLFRAVLPARHRDHASDSRGNTE